MKSRVSERGQVTIPKSLRDRLGISPGQVLEFAAEEGRLVACEVVWAELSARFAPSPAVQEALRRLTVGFSASGVAVALDAGAVMAEYRRRGGTRDRVIADFLAARATADRLLTRDRGFFRTYFAGLQVVDPGVP